MILSHTNTAFPHRRRLLIAGIALCLLLAPFFPAEDMLMRIASPLVVVVVAAIAHGFMLLALSFSEKAFPRVAFYEGLFFYYVGIFGAPLIPLFWWLAINEPGVDNSTVHMNPMMQIASCWATAAAAYNVILGPRSAA